MKQTRREVLEEQNIPFTSRFFYKIDVAVKKTLMGENHKLDQTFNLIALVLSKNSTRKSTYIFKELERYGLIGQDIDILAEDKIVTIISEYNQRLLHIKHNQKQTNRTQTKIHNLEKLYTLLILEELNPDFKRYEHRVDSVQQTYLIQPAQNYLVKLSREIGMAVNDNLIEKNIHYLSALISIITIHALPHTYEEGLAIKYFERVYQRLPGINLKLAIIGKVYHYTRTDDSIKYGLIQDLHYIHDNEEEFDEHKGKGVFKLHKYFLLLAKSIQYKNFVKTTIFVLVTKSFLIAILIFLEGTHSLIRNLAVLGLMILVGFIISKLAIINYRQEKKKLNQTELEIQKSEFEISERINETLIIIFQTYKYLASITMLIVLFISLKFLHFSNLEIGINLFLFALLLNSAVEIHRSIEKEVVKLNSVLRINYFLMIFLGFVGINEFGKWTVKRYRDADPLLKLYSISGSVLLKTLGRLFENVKSVFIIIGRKIQSMIHKITSAGM